MAVPFLAGYGAAKLLNDDEERPIINKVFTPLTEKQANLYMTTSEYEQKSDNICKSIFLYIDRYNCYRPKPLKNRSTGEIKHINYTQATRLINAEKKAKRQSHKTILMTKGINGLPEYKIARQTPLSAYIFGYLCCFICIGIEACVNACVYGCDKDSSVEELPDLIDGLNYAPVNQAQLNLLKIPDFGTIVIRK